MCDLHVVLSYNKGDLDAVKRQLTAGTHQLRPHGRTIANETSSHVAAEHAGRGTGLKIRTLPMYLLLLLLLLLLLRASLLLMRRRRLCLLLCRRTLRSGCWGVRPPHRGWALSLYRTEHHSCVKSMHGHTGSSVKPATLKFLLSPLGVLCATA